MDLEDQIARQVREIPRSGIRDFFELVVGRDDVISLGVGEPDFATPWHIREAAIFSLDKGQTSYTSNLGMPRLRNAISRHIERKNRVAYDPDTEILVTVGVSEALDLAFRALLNPGDEVLFHQPCYVSYNPSITMAYGVGVPVPTRIENDFILLADEVESRITSRTRALVLNFPTNPTGALEPFEELEKIAGLCREHELIVVTDEIYRDLVYDNAPCYSILDFPGMRERTILLNGFSKAYAMTGFRVGYACAPNTIIEAMMKIHQYAMLCAPITSQAAGVEALENGGGPVEEMRKSYQMRRNMIVRRLQAMGLRFAHPRGAFYAFPDVSGTGMNGREFALKLLEEESVAVVPGDGFGENGGDCVRMCYAADPRQLEEALLRLERFVARRGKPVAAG